MQTFKSLAFLMPNFLAFAFIAISCFRLLPSKRIHKQTHIHVTAIVAVVVTTTVSLTTEGRAYISPEDQRKMVATRLIHEVFVRVVVGAPPQWSKEATPLPVCTHQEVKRSVGDPIEGPRILANCRLSPDFSTAPYNLERTGWLWFKSPPGWAWTLDIDDARACSRFVEEFIRAYQFLRTVLRDPSDVRGIERFRYDISGHPIWFSLGQTLSIRGIRALDAECQAGLISIRLVP